MNRDKYILKEDKDSLYGHLEDVQDNAEDKKVKEAILKREKEISALLEASKAVLKYSDFKTSSRAIFDACTDLIGVPAGYVALLTPDKKENLVVFLNPGGYICTVDPDLPMPIRGMRGEVVKSKKPLYNNSFPETDWLRFMPKGHVDLKNVLFTPLIVDDEVQGLMGMANKPGGFTEEDAKLAMAFTEFVSIALQNSQALESLEDSEQRYKNLSLELEQIVIERTKNLKESEEKFRYLFDNAQVGLYWSRISDGIILECNNTFAKLFGYDTREECLANYNTVEHSIDPNARSEIVKEIRENKEVKNYEIHVTRRDNTPIWLSISARMFEKENRIEGAAIDITERKKAERELQLERDNFLNILNSMEDGVYIVDKSYDINYVNPSLIEEFGQFEGIKCFKYFEDRNEICPRCKNREVFQGKTLREEWFSFKNQKTYDLIDTPLKNPDGSISKLGILRDATEKKQAEKIISDLSKFPAENPNPVLRVSKEKVLYANSMAVDLLNITEKNDIPDILKEEIHETFRTKSQVMFDIKLNNYTYSIVITPIISEGYVNIYGRNITKRKEMEEKYRKQNVFLSNILESLTHPFYVINADDYTIALANFTASSEGLELGQYCYSLTHNNTKPCEAPCMCPLDEVKKTKKPCVVEHLHYAKEGYEKIYEIYGYPILDESGNVVHMIEYALNITDRKIAQQELKESEEKFRTITEQSFMGIIIIQDGFFKYFNQRAVDVSGYSLEEIQNWKEYEYLKVIHPEDLDFVKGQARKTRDGKNDVLNHYTYRIIKKSGEIAWMDNYSKTINYRGRSADLVVTEDITDKIKAEQQLKESEEKFRKQNVFLSNILESLTHPFYVINADDYTVALANFTASSEGLELGEHCYSLTHDNNKPCEAPCKCPLDEVKRTKNNCLVEHTHSDSKGNEKIYEIYGYPILDESGNVVQMIEYALNITDRKIAQRELKESEENYRDLFENSPISLWEQDYSEIKKYIDKLKNSGIDDLRSYFDKNPEEVKKCVSMVKIININQETIKLFKANNEEDFVAGLDNVFLEESFDTFKEQIITFAGGKKRFESEAVNYALNGDKLDIFIVCEIVAGLKEDWSKILISIVDISEIKKAELIIQNEITNLRELDQLKNEFIVRTSHELKTPLVSICGSVEFLLNYIEEDFSMKSRAHLETIDSGGKRLSQLADNLLDILRIESHKYEIKVETINLGNIIKKCISDYNDLAEEREITISTSFQHEFYVKADEVKIKQVFDNLLSNSLKNTPHYGQISISSEEAQDYINIKFTDNGTGFTEEEKTRVFEKLGKIEKYGKGMDIITEGSGIGLYLSKEIVELHGGKIWLESEGRNKGSTFTVSLPIDEK